MSSLTLETLFDKYYQRTASTAELAQLAELVRATGDEALAQLITRAGDTLVETDSIITAERVGQILQQILKGASQETPMVVAAEEIHEAANEDQGRKAPIVPLWRRLRWVAAVLLFLGLGGATYYWVQQQKGGTSSTITAKPIDIEPGKDGAILTLANGSQVVLDSLGNGLVANQNGTLVNLQKGQLTYSPVKGSRPKNEEEILFNTMATPRGRQFMIVLPDGTKVWLNAASSLRYPTRFNSRGREVYVTGEAYFEVAKTGTPFVVTINEETAVQVLGTHFNINAYSNEASTNTTLLEGKVKVSSTAGSVILSLGKQAQVMGGNIKVVTANVDQVMAWKNGLIALDGLTLEQVMRQLERWYDITVVYEKGVPAVELAGKLSRNLSLSGLLKGLEGADLHYRMEEGRRLVVLP